MVESLDKNDIKMVNEVITKDKRVQLVEIDEINRIDKDNWY